MITGISSKDDDNRLKDIVDNLIESEKRNQEHKKQLIKELKKTTHSEREFIIFKYFYHELSNYDKDTIMYLFKLNPFIFEKLFKYIEYAKESRKYSEVSFYNRGCCVELVTIYKSLLNKMSSLSKELALSNSLELSILFSYLLWNGYLSRNRKHEYKEIEHDILGLLFIEIVNGDGVCRNYSEMLKDFLKYNGYNSIMLANYFDYNTNVEYKMDIDRIDSYKIQNISDKSWFKKKKANHVFNLIDDNGLYIYDPTNLLLYRLQNKDICHLINGKGKNIIYPYRSYDLCYAKEDEKLLDRLFTEDSFSSPYDKTDFISTSEVTLELMRDSTTLLEDFYKEIRPDLVGISKETKKVLAKNKIIK